MIENKVSETFFKFVDNTNTNTNKTKLFVIQSPQDCKLSSELDNNINIQCHLQTNDNEIIRSEISISLDSSNMNNTSVKLKIQEFLKPPSSYFHQMTETDKLLAVQYIKNIDGFRADNIATSEEKECNYEIIVYSNSEEKIIKPIAQLDCSEIYQDDKVSINHNYGIPSISTLNNKLTVGRLVTFKKREGDTTFTKSGPSFHQYSIQDEAIEFLTTPQKISPPLKSKLHSLEKIVDQKIWDWEMLRVEIRGIQGLDTRERIIKPLSKLVIDYTEPEKKKEEDDGEQEQEKKEDKISPSGSWQKLLLVIFVFFVILLVFGILLCIGAYGSYFIWNQVNLKKSKNYNSSVNGIENYKKNLDIDPSELL